MTSAIRDYLRRFRASRPGCRFQDNYERKRASRGGAAYRYAAMAAGILVFLVGVFFLAVSRGTAQLLDRTELRLRRLFRRKAGG